MRSYLILLPITTTIVGSLLFSSFCADKNGYESSYTDTLIWRSEKNGQYHLHYTEADTNILAATKNYLITGNSHINKFFAQPFLHSFETYIFPERAQLDKQWQQDWSDTSFHSQCWMVASGVGDRLDILSTNAWAKDACDHDGNDSAELRRLIWHEMVHVYHGQHNADHKFEKMENMDWLVEGVATYVAGQLTEKRISAVKKSIAEGKQPTQLNQFWKGNLRYGLAGSLVGYIDQKFGRKKLFHLQQLSSTEAALTFLGTTEQQIIGEWNKSFS